MFSVIFDMDGTLFDTQKICIPAWEYGGIVQGVKGMGGCIADVCGMNEIGWTTYIEENYPELDVEKFKKDMREYIIENGKVKFKDGAEELLEFLCENNIKYAIASGSSKKTILHHLGEVGALDKFDIFVGGKDVENGKPAPDIFLLAAEKLGAKPEECFVFEDSGNGIRAAHSAGMKCIGIPDVAIFKEEEKALMFAELNNFSEAINLFKEYL